MAVVARMLNYVREIFLEVNSGINEIILAVAAGKQTPSSRHD